ncbi:MAG TPA: HIT family protein [Fibrobacteria bacterium]|nr:HIT family protein [Fibrobacteria bacterium]
MATLFTRIIKGEIPSQKILEDDRFLAFLDIRPIAPGHTLVVPKVEVDELFDVDPDILAGALPFAQKVARAIKHAVPCKRVGVMVAGLEIPHAHIHLIPMQHEGDLSFSRARPAGPEELAAVADAIRSRL